MVITKSEIIVLLSRKTVHHPNAVRSLITSALLMRKVGKYAKYCKKGKPCAVMGETMTFDMKAHKTTYCFAVYTKNSGSTKKSSELELL